MSFTTWGASVFLIVAIKLQRLFFFLSLTTTANFLTPTGQYQHAPVAWRHDMSSHLRGGAAWVTWGDVKFGCKCTWELVTLEHHGWTCDVEVNCMAGASSVLLYRFPEGLQRITEVASGWHGYASEFPSLHSISSTLHDYKEMSSSLFLFVYLV